MHCKSTITVDGNDPPPIQQTQFRRNISDGLVALVTSDEAVGFGEERVLFLKELKDMHLIVATCPMAKNAETDQVNSCQVV